MRELQASLPLGITDKQLTGDHCGVTRVNKIKCTFLKDKLRDVLFRITQGFSI